jgi:hypothetical protein
VTAEWQKRTGMNLEEEFVKEIYQKDVNNYVYITDDNKIKCKGGYVSKYNGGDFQQNSLVAIDKAVVNYLIFNKSIMETFKECNLIDFQIICSRSGKYDKTIASNPHEELDKVNRVFAFKYHTNRQIYKTKGDNKYLFPNLPPNCLVWNSDLSKVSVEELDCLDFNWYKELAEKRIEDFLGK